MPAKWALAAALLQLTAGLRAPVSTKAPRTLRHATLDSTVLSLSLIHI